MRLIDANKLRADICKWLKPSVPDETEMVAIDDIGVSVIMEIEEHPTVFEIPENPTNGDMVKALFGEDISNECIDYLCKIRKCGEWWNAPYKKGDASE